MILILSEPADAHLPYVTQHIPKDEYMVIDATSLVEGATLHLNVENGITKAYYNGRQLNNITGVWVRRPSHVPDIELPVEERFIPYVRSALSKTVNQLYDLFPNATWISNHYALRRANNKVLQLQTAAKVGLYTPKTILSSDSGLIRQFIDENEDVIMKPVATTYPVTADGIPRLFFTSKVDRKKSIDLSGAHLAQTFFQERITPRREIRVTIVGDKVFAATVRTDKQKANSHVRDWRYGYVEGSVYHEEYELPSHVIESCIALTKELGLTFGACDFIEDKQGKLWFLEINPNGQWAFIEQTTGQRIGQAIAELLGAPIQNKIT